MQRVHIWAVLSVLLAPATAYACLATWTLLFAPVSSATTTTTTKWQSRLLILAALAALRAQWGLLSKLRWALRSRRLGCGEPALYPHRDPVLGLDWFLESLRAMRDGTFAQLSTARFSLFGHTHFNIGLGTWVLVTDEPENVKAILATSFADWEIAGPRLWAALPQLGPRSVFTSNGEVWHRARAVIRPSFVRDEIADLARFDAHVGNLVGLIRRECDGGRATVDLQGLFARLTMDSSTDFMLGRSTDLLLDAQQPEAVEFLRAFDYCSWTGSKRARLGPILRLLPDREFARAIKTTRRYVRSYVAGAMAARKARAAAQGGTVTAAGEKKSYVFLDELVDSGADEDYVLDQVLSIILAGRDTTASGLSSLFYYLARDPEAVRKIRREIAELGTRDPTWEQLRGMKYMQNAIREALRLLPPVGANSRTANKDTILPRGGGPDGQKPLLIPKGTSCRYWFYSMHRRKDLYGPDADEFRPERWEKLRTGWDYVPFSGGPRICIGQQFALTQMTYTVFRVLQNFELIEPRENGPMGLMFSITMSFTNGVQVGITPARDSA